MGPSNHWTATSEFRIPRSAREWNYVANVRYSREEHQEPLEPGPETGMWHGPVPAQVHIPAVIFLTQFVVAHILAQPLQPFLALRPADHFADARHEQVHGRDRFAVIIQTHVE